MILTIFLYQYLKSSPIDIIFQRDCLNCLRYGIGQVSGVVEKSLPRVRKTDSFFSISSTVQFVNRVFRRTGKRNRFETKRRNEKMNLLYFEFDSNVLLSFFVVFSGHQSPAGRSCASCLTLFKMIKDGEEEGSYSSFRSFHSTFASQV